MKDISPSAGDTIVFQTIVQNEGGGYNAKTGIFIAPVSGTYLFTTQLCLYAGKLLSVSIIVNEVVITTAYFGNANYNQICSTTDGLSNMMQGDKVRVTVLYSGNRIYPDSSTIYWSYFSGVLLHK